MAKILLRRSCREPLSRVHYYDTATRDAFSQAETIAVCTNYSRSEAESIDQYCDGNDRINVYHDGRGGVVFAWTENGCQPDPVCDISITSITSKPYKIGEETFGELTATANKTNFSYNIRDNSGSSIRSGIITDGIINLQSFYPGVYKLYISESGDVRKSDIAFLPPCHAVASFSFEQLISYNLKWFFEYQDINGVTTRVEIEGKNYSGTAIEIEYISALPLQIEWKGRGEDKYRQIIPTECVLNVISKVGFEYISLFSSDDKEHRVNVKKGGVLFWTGYILPDVYSEPYLSPPYEMSVSAVDGLLSLENVEYERIPEYDTFFDVIMHCLKSTDYDLDITESTFIYPFGISAQTPLKANIVKNIAYDGLNCYEVLQRVLFASMARLYQSNGKWHIIPIDTLNAPYNERTYDSSGTLLITNLINPVLEIGNARDARPFFINRSQNLNVTPAWKELTVTQDYGLEENIIKNGDFVFNEDGTLDNWQGSVYFKRTYKDRNETKEALGFINNSVYQQVPIAPGNGGATLDIEIELMANVVKKLSQHIIEFEFTEGNFLSMAFLINGEVTTYERAGSFQTSADNAQSFLNGLASVPGFTGNYTALKNGNIVKITSSSTDIKYDYGNVEIKGYASIHSRTNTIFDPKGLDFVFKLFAYGDFGERSLTPSGFFGERYIDRQVSSPVANEIRIPVTKIGEWISYKFSTELLPEGTTAITLNFQGVQGLSGSNVELYENLLRKAYVIFKPYGQYAPATDILTVENPNKKNLTFIPNGFTLYHGEPPISNMPNAANIYKNLLYHLSGGQYTITNFFNENENPKKLIGIIADRLLFANKTPKQVITGTFKGNIALHNSFTDVFNPGKLFIVNSLKLNDRHKEYEVEMVEMEGYSRVVQNGRLLENGSYRLLENGDYRTL